MAENPVIPKLEDLKQAFIESNQVEAEKKEANESKRSEDLKEKIAELSKETPKNIQKITDQQAAVNKKILVEEKKGDKADLEIIERLTSQNQDLEDSKEIQIKSNKDDLARFKADLKFQENEIANRVPVSETQKQFEAARQAEERQKKYYESQGLRAEDNAKFRQDQFKRQKKELDFRIKNATSPSAREELEKERQQLLNKQTDGILGLKNAIVSGFKGLADKRVPGVGLSFGDIAKLALLPAFIAFLQSPVWEKIKAFLNDPSWTKFGEIIGEYPILLGTLVTIVGGYAISKIVGVAKKLALAFTAVSTGLTTLGGIFGLGAVAAAGTIVAIVAGVVLTAKGLYDAFVAFSNTFKETKSIMASLKEAAVEFVGTVVGLPFDLLKDITAYLAEQLGFEKFADTLKQFSVEEIVKDSMRKIFGFFEEFFGDIVKIFSGETMQARLDGLFGTLSGIGDIILAPLNLVLDTVRGFFSLAGIDLPDFELQDLIKGLFDEVTDLFRKVLSIDVGAIFDEAKQKVLDAIETVKASIPVPDFSVVGDKIAALAMFFSPTRLLNMIGDAIEKADFVTGTGFLKKPLLKIFGTTAQTAAKQAEEKLQSDADVNAMQSGGFLPAGKFALVGEQGPELVMTKGPSQVFSEQRTDALGAAALNNMMSGGGMGGGGNVVIAPNQVQNNTRQTVVRPLSIQDPIIDKMTSSLAI